MSEENSAIDLRIRLVREVAGNYANYSNLARLTENAHSKLRAIEGEKKKHLGLLMDEIKEQLERGTLLQNVLESAKEHTDLVEKCKEDARMYEYEASSSAQQAQKFRDLAHLSLRSIIEDVIAGNYGRGEVKLFPQKAIRLIGVVEDHDENVDSLMRINCERGKLFQLGSISEITQMCELGKYPLFEVPLNTMPMTKDEEISICKYYDDLSLIMKYVGEENISWDLGSIYLVEKSSSFDLYVISTGSSIYFVKITYDIYPERTVSIVGSFGCFDFEVAEEMKKVAWEDEIMPHLKKKEINAGPGIVFSMIANHLSNKNPGLILHFPQLESEK